ncbi:uncharacterized protein EV154DRAFT_564344 [Mucor mucedo]|uniref:uncharacterized protein n=1 Tax=Mucor mucedo TaxID=29922 RepID=UPI0022207BCC|nr:uncharacterized protein EV154DRAFT_564344 [Mucor mucedo]KAI7890465.1 hypothetical protein EV154DRAFT_564344 [Mucor mucedo]
MRLTGILEILTAEPTSAPTPEIVTSFEPALNNVTAGRATLFVHQRLARLERNTAGATTEEVTLYDNVAANVHKDTHFPVAKNAIYPEKRKASLLTLGGCREEEVLRY